MAGFMSNNPLADPENKAQLGSNTVQGGRQQASSGPGPVGSLMQQAAAPVAGAAFTAGTNALAGAATPALATLGTSLGGTAAAGAGLGGMAAMAPMLAAAGPFALMALPFLLNDGTAKVPSPYGPDPLKGSLPGYNYGSKKIPGYKNGGIIEEVGEHIMNPLGIAGRALGFNNGTNMAYAGGEDTVPTMLTPGEAVIPAAAAQNPNNQPMIDSMIEEGRGANAIAEGQAPMATQAPMAAQAPMPAEATLPMAGPLSGPAQRAQVEALQDMAMKKKAFEAEEMRKQQAFEQKLALDKQKALMSMQT